VAGVQALDHDGLCVVIIGRPVFFVSSNLLIVNGPQWAIASFIDILARACPKLH
jgi:hypothetical protein